MVLLVLGVVWAVVLFSWFRTRLRTNFGDPVTTFRRNLTVLESVDARTRRPAQARLAEGRLARGQLAEGRLTIPRGVAYPVAVPRRPLAPGLALPSPSGRSAAMLARRRQTLRRRRDVLLGLGGGAIGSLLLGVLPGLHALLVAQVIFDLTIGIYVSLLVRLRNLAAERRRKVAYLPRTRPLSTPPGGATAYAPRAAAGELPRAASAGATIRATPLEAWAAPAGALR